MLSDILIYNSDRFLSIDTENNKIIKKWIDSLKIPLFYDLKRYIIEFIDWKNYENEVEIHKLIKNRANFYSYNSVKYLNTTISFHFNEIPFPSYFLSNVPNFINYLNLIINNHTKKKLVFSHYCCNGAGIVFDDYAKKSSKFKFI